MGILSINQDVVSVSMYNVAVVFVWWSQCVEETLIAWPLKLNMQLIHCEGRKKKAPVCSGENLLDLVGSYAAGTRWPS